MEFEHVLSALTCVGAGCKRASPKQLALTYTSFPNDGASLATESRYAFLTEACRLNVFAMLSQPTCGDAPLSWTGCWAIGCASRKEIGWTTLCLRFQMSRALQSNVTRLPSTIARHDYNVYIVAVLHPLPSCNIPRPGWYVKTNSLR